MVSNNCNEGSKGITFHAPPPILEPLTTSSPPLTDSEEPVSPLDGTDKVSEKE